MNCKKCGSPLNAGARFCQNCGEGVEESVEPVNSQQAMNQTMEVSPNSNQPSLVNEYNPNSNFHPTSAEIKKVNRVFCYSKEVAKQNGNGVSILRWALLATILSLIFAVGIVALADYLKGNTLLIFLLIIFFMLIITYYSLVFATRLRARLIGWATTDDNRIFKAMTINNGQGLYLGSVAAGSMVDQLTKSNNNVGSNVGSAVGAASVIFSVNRSAQYMSHPEIVAKMVEEAPNITGAIVTEILKVYNVTEKKHSFVVKCDYKLLETGKVYFNKKIIIGKSYNALNDLIGAINTHRQ